MKQILVKWLPNTTEDPVPVKIRRNWFWPFSRNVTFGRTIFEGGPDGINDATLRHELVHVAQYSTHGWFWVFTHPNQREIEAHQVEKLLWPTWRYI